MAALALIVHDGVPRPRERRLAKVLDFFAIPFVLVAAGDLSTTCEDVASHRPYVLCLSLDVLSSAMTHTDSRHVIRRATALYVYAVESRVISERALQCLPALSGWTFEPRARENVTLTVADEPSAITGPMAGVTATARLRAEDFVLVPPSDLASAAVRTVVAAGGSPVFLQLYHDDVPAFVCASAAMVDLDEPVSGHFYDVKEHFCSAVPLVLFLRWAFADVIWKPQELGSCLIIDDPLLKRQYGFCNFNQLQTLMRGHGFTTNIAFIPWNWRRTTSKARELFGDQSMGFSVSVHGCDHTAGEFGESSKERLEKKAALARARMRRHEARTGIPYDSIMVFPQGVFSADSPGVLKRNGFLAAVNTEVHPVDVEAHPTLIRDVWDVAITKHSAFPIFTRRYPFHGVENFAFDMLLGKPCLIVAHHRFFSDGCAELIRLIEQLHGLRASLRWRSLGEVVRRACRRRVATDGGSAGEEIQMYASELVVVNGRSVPVDVRVRKREEDASLVTGAAGAAGSIGWSVDAGDLVLQERVPPAHETLLTIAYREAATRPASRGSIAAGVAVAARRLLSEFRDEYLHRLAP